MTPPACPICANTSGNRLLSVCEKMNGTLEAFNYAQCPACGHLYLATPLTDISPYYATGYYSFHSRPIPAWRQWFYRWRTAAALGGGGISGRLMNRLKPPFYAYWLEQTGLRLGNRVLDVGCGAGNLIRILQVAGLQCTGIDPFLPGDTRTPEGAQLLKADLLTEERLWHAILFNHSFEHVPNPREVLTQAARLLEPGGCVVVRIPLSDSFAFFHYGPNWVQWDSPRHLSLFTRNSFAILAEQCGLHVDTTLEDSSRMQFWGSEEYRRNIFHNSKESYGHNPRQTTFSRLQLRNFDRWASWLNDMDAGDQATFICRRAQTNSV